MSDTGDTRLAILGCGAIAEQLYLPAMRHLPGARITLLVDGDADRRGGLASRFDVAHTHDTIDQCYDLFDAAIVALPPALRQPACIKLLTQRKAALVEPPIAFSVTEFDDMIRASEQTNTLLAVAQIRRFLRAHRFARFLIESGTWGRIESFDFRNGYIDSGPIGSDLSFRKEIAGGGVLIDMGVHVLDGLLHWLGDFSDVEYFDDAAGGVEANCLLNLRLRNGVSGVVELSRTRQLRNTAIIRCGRGSVEIGLDANNSRLTFANQPYALGGLVGDLREPGQDQDDLGLTRALVEDFVAAIRNGRKVEADAPSARSTIGLIDICYRRRRPLQSTWAYQEATGNA
ncbi:Gfo/Idh/MocA family oxidoreductase [Bradyrhizobium sp. dw_78]|uniref:Gfo/Idh/MocA family protein n=1 Tax=Bradyrhizobium sp. dw_78 TaxID=2719793 RepID=UPI001BD591AB|nr:Gfo/Idh/MocA family oxidoreductase [Bradyrhizobium sp. dw_78]